MDYLIDTNIAYYLADISKDINFDIESFRKDETPKLISSISVLELYLKNDLKKFRKIMEHLNIYITSDKHWQNFLKRYSASNKCANLSYTAICKFYKNMK